MREATPERLRGATYMGALTHALPVRAFRDVLAYPYPLHWHDFYELLCVTGGTGVHIVNGIRLPIARGSMALLTPVDFHALVPTGEAPLCLYNVIFTAPLLTEPLHDLLFAAGADTTDLAAPDPDALVSEFAMLYDESSACLPGAALMIETTLKRLLVRVARLARSRGVSTDTTPAPLADRTTHDAVRRALYTLDHHFREPITLSDLAASVHLSPHYFSEQFHMGTGMTFQAYLGTLRLTFAAALLRASDVPITEVCAASGFNAIAHFNRAFKRRYGCSPRQYRAG